MSDAMSLHDLRAAFHQYRVDGATSHRELRKLRLRLADAEDDLRRANAEAWRTVEGRNASEREANVAEETREEKDAVTRAQIEVDYGKGIIRQRDNDVSTLQTEAKLAEIEFRLLGRGEA
ncbi:MAG: hypothetical protein NVSMB4_01630 [Acidimicrobiales bacterium]